MVTRPAFDDCSRRRVAFFRSSYGVSAEGRMRTSKTLTAASSVRYGIKFANFCGLVCNLAIREVRFKEQEPCTSFLWPEIWPQYRGHIKCSCNVQRREGSSMRGSANYAEVRTTDRWYCAGSLCVITLKMLNNFQPNFRVYLISMKDTQWIPFENIS